MAGEDVAVVEAAGPGDRRTAAGRPSWFIAWLDFALIVTGLGLLAPQPPAPMSYDASIRYQALLTFVHTGRPASMEYSFLGPLFAAPLWYIGHLGPGPEWWVMRYNLILLGLLLLALWALLRNRIDRSLLRIFLLVLVAASMFGWHTQDFLGEMFTAVLVGAGALLVVTRPQLLGWLGLAVGTANTPAAGLGLALLCAKRALDLRRLRFLVVPVASGTLIVADTWFRNRQVLAGQYLTVDHGIRTLLPYSGRPGFSYPVFFGLISILFSFGKGLFFFAPGLLLPVRQALRRIDPALASAYVLWLAFLVGMVLVYSGWWAWYGGLSWGPRFLLVASLPASLALATWLRYPPRGALPLAGVFAALLLSCWVGVNGLVFGDPAGACIANHLANEHLCWYVPEFSTLWHPFVAPPGDLALRQLALLAYGGAVLVRLAGPLLAPAVEAGRTTFSTWRRLARGWAI